MPGMDKLKALESFVSVATRGSLTAAAQAEGVAPAIMGRRLDALEERLGVKLLVRTTRRITLTHEGSAFLEDCQRLLADLANAEASVSAGGLALVFAYPYVPGSNSRAFTGFSVLAGLMLSLGSSGLINHMMSGLVIIYSRALSPGDYVRVGELRPFGGS